VELLCRKNYCDTVSWAGKSDAFRALQAPSTDTLVPCKEESVNFETTGNLFIEGENLEVLKVLQKAYFGKIKMIYIDPPYNTGNDTFIYPDRFSESKEEYLNRIGDKDETGLMTREGLFRKNSKDSGHYHSNWLSMMYPRLFLARNLLRDDGVIFVSIDDNEVHNLRLLMNEIFGEENFISQITVQSNPRGRQSDAFFATVHEYVMIYSRNAEECTLSGSVLSEEQKANFDLIDHKGMKYRLLGLRQRGSASFRKDRPEMFFPIFVNPKKLTVSLTKTKEFSEEVLPKKSTGEDGRWMWGRQRVETHIELLTAKLIERRGEYDIFVRDYLERSGKERERKFKTIWDDKEFNTQNGTQEVKSIIKCDAIPYPKPVALLKSITGMGSEENDIILDFFSGSSTTAHAVLEQNKKDGGNRKFICVQLPEKCDVDSEAFKAGYKTIAEIGKERIRRVIKQNQEEQDDTLALDGNGDRDFGFKVFKLKESNFKIWRSNIETEEELVAQMQKHLEPLDETAKAEDVLYELLIKSGVQLTAKIKDQNGYILVNDNEIALMLEKTDDKIIKKIIAAKPQKVFTLDRLFKNNDKLKTNTALQMKDASIEFKVI
jgi:adenine-specific DNA-methyltransferase